MWYRNAHEEVVHDDSDDNDETYKEGEDNEERNDGDDDSSDYDSGKRLMLRRKQPFAFEPCKFQGVSPSVTSSSHWWSVRLFSIRSH